VVKPARAERSPEIPRVVKSDLGDGGEALNEPWSIAAPKFLGACPLEPLRR